MHSQNSIAAPLKKVVTVTQTVLFPPIKSLEKKCTSVAVFCHYCSETLSISKRRASVFCFNYVELCYMSTFKNFFELIAG